MNRLTLIIFALFTASVAFLHFAESSEGEEALNKVEILDDQEGDSELLERSGVMAKGSAIAGSTNSLRPLFQVPSNPRPGGIHTDALECYACTDCPKIYENTTSKICPHSLDVTREKKCVVYAEQYRHMKRSWYIRGCASERGSCADIKKAHDSHSDIVNLLFCRECEGDKCNTSGGDRSLFDLTLAVFAVIISPIVAKYTLS